jgi:hypothetical protein
MRVRIVCYEDVDKWILGKFAVKLSQELRLLGVSVDISKKPDPSADVNHHIIYVDYDEKNTTSLDTIMITHIDDIRKLNQVRRQLEVAKAGICMSNSTMIDLVSAGLPSEKLCYINPAHDNIIIPRRIILGITSKVQPDGCKREDFLLKLSKVISPKDFAFKIMGAGWESIIDKLVERGFIIEYHNQFDAEKYKIFFSNLDYYLYFGMDEGSMGFIDALNAGVKTIVTPQGYHLDAQNGITHAFIDFKDLVKIFAKIAQERNMMINAVSQWTWRDYAIKHFELWQYLKNNFMGESIYSDGVNSLIKKQEENSARNFKINLYRGFIRRAFSSVRKRINFKNKLN